MKKKIVQTEKITKEIELLLEENRVIKKKNKCFRRAVKLFEIF